MIFGRWSVNQTVDSEGSRESSSTSAPRRWYKTGQGVLAVVSVFFVIGSLLKDKHIFAEATEIPIRDIAVIIGVLIGAFLLHAQRFVLLIDEHCRCRIPLLEWVRMLVMVRFLNNLVPQMGSIHRGIALKRDFGVSYTDYIAANVFFVWTDTLFNFLIALVLFQCGAAHLELFGLSTGAFFALSSIALLLGPFAAQRLLRRGKSRSKIVRKLAEVADELLEGLRSPRYMVATTALAIASFVLMTFVFRMLLSAIGAEVDLATLAVFYALYRLTFHINVTPGNVGIREIAYGLLCAQAHIGMSQGLLIAAELRVLSIVVLLIIAVSVAGRALREALIQRVRGRLQAEGDGG